jgi:phage terminase small subunit
VVEVLEHRPKPSIKGIAVQARHEVFKQAYASNGGNATQAAITAGYSQKTARVIGSQLVARLALRSAEQTNGQRALEKSGLDRDRLIEELARICFADPRKFYHRDGRLKKITELDDATAAALSSMDLEEITTGRGSKRRVLGVTAKIRMHDKLQAIEKAMRHLNMFERDNRSRAPSLAIQVNAVAPRPRREDDE